MARRRPVTMLLSPDPAAARAELDRRLRTLLPPDYQDKYERIEPKPMRAAGLKYAPDGTVAWDEIWGSFCDLAMAGGPPHKGTLLLPGAADAASADTASQLDAVVAEVRRGIEMVTSMPVDPAPSPGWVRVECYSTAMAGWLLRAITMENVAVRADGIHLALPVSPAFRLEKEIKNVITVIAKTSHYWLEHMPLGQQRSIAALFSHLDRASPLVEPAWPESAEELAACARTATIIAHQVETMFAPAGASSAPGPEAVVAPIAATAPPADAGLSVHPGWLGIPCADVRSAVQLMRALVCLNVLARREETTLFVPVNPVVDPEGARTWSALGQLRQAGLTGITATGSIARTE